MASKEVDKLVKALQAVLLGADADLLEEQEAAFEKVYEQLSEGQLTERAFGPATFTVVGLSDFDLYFPLEVAQILQAAFMAAWEWGYIVGKNE